MLILIRFTFILMSFTWHSFINLVAPQMIFYNFVSLYFDSLLNLIFTYNISLNQSSISSIIYYSTLAFCIYHSTHLPNRLSSYSILSFTPFFSSKHSFISLFIESLILSIKHEFFLTFLIIIVIFILILKVYILLI